MKKILCVLSITFLVSPALAAEGISVPQNARYVYYFNGQLFANPDALFLPVNDPSVKAGQGRVKIIPKYKKVCFSDKNKKIFKCF